MTLLPSYSHPPKMSFWSICIPLTSRYNLQLRTKEKMGPCLFWIYWYHLEEMAVSVHLYIGSPPTQTCICSGGAIILCHLSIVSLGHSSTGHIPSAPIHSCCKKKKNIWNQALKKCQYPTWALTKIKHKMKNPGTRTTKNNNSNITQKSFIVVPYYAGLSENIQNIGRKFGVQVHCKGGTTIKNLLMAPKDKDPMLKQSGVIYRYHCDRVDCDEEYIGESSRTFGERFKEHLKPPSPIFDHSNISGHNVSINNFKIVGREDLNQMRAIKEAIYIRVNDPSLNRNVGKYHLPHVWDEVLANISELKLK